MFFLSFLLGPIRDSDSSMILKDDDGCDIKLTILRNPIPLDSLICEDEDSLKIDKKINVSAAKKRFSNALQRFKTKDAEMKTITFLKEPIPLDKVDFDDNSSATFNVKTVEGSIHKRSRKTKKDEKHELWMGNAATIFELSYVYPFIYTNNKYKCFVCLEPFHDANILKQHTMNHNHKEIRQKLLNNTENNTILKVDVTHLQCRVCDKTFHSLQELKSHLLNHAKDIEVDTQDNIIPFRLGCEPFQCQICGDEYPKLRLLIIHMSKHFNNFSCEVCGSVFISKKSLRRHLQTHESGTFPCEKCNKVFSSSAKKTLHIRGVHLKHLPRRCPICPERFNSDYMRTKHLRIVHNRTAALNRCVACGKEYDLKYQLQLHIRSVHYQEKNQECPVCHSRFFSKYLLSRHLVIHTGIKNFKCEVCGKAYSRKAHLNQHSKSHVVE